MEDKERIYTLLPKVMGNYSFFFPKVLVLSALILVLTEFSYISNSKVGFDIE